MQQPARRRQTRVHLLTVWSVVSALWTLATLMRINQLWVPLIGWHRIIQGPWIWISLIAPPSIFALVLGAIYRKAAERVENDLHRVR